MKPAPYPYHVPQEGHIIFREDVNPDLREILTEMYADEHEGNLTWVNPRHATFDFMLIPASDATDEVHDFNSASDFFNLLYDMKTPDFYHDVDLTQSTDLEDNDALARILRATDDPFDRDYPTTEEDE